MLVNILLTGISFTQGALEQRFAAPKAVNHILLVPDQIDGSKFWLSRCSLDCSGEEARKNQRFPRRPNVLGPG